LKLSLFGDEIEDIEIPEEYIPQIWKKQFEKEIQKGFEKMNK